MRENREKKRGKSLFAWGAVAASFVAICFVGAYVLLEDGFNFDISPAESTADNAMTPEVAGAYDIIPTEESIFRDRSFNDSDSGAVYGESPLSTDEEDFPDVRAFSRPADAEAQEQWDAGLSRTNALSPLSAPDGWQIIFRDTDDDTAIYHMESPAGNMVNVVLSAEPIHHPQNDDFREIFIGITPAYLLTEETHSILFFNWNGIQMVLSTAQDFSELLELANFWI